MTDRNDFIELEILPTLGEFADDFDVDAIVDEVSEFDPVDGYVMAVGEDEYWEAVRRHDIGGRE